MWRKAGTETVYSNEESRKSVSKQTFCVLWSRSRPSARLRESGTFRSPRHNRFGKSFGTSKSTCRFRVSVPESRKLLMFSDIRSHFPRSAAPSQRVRHRMAMDMQMYCRHIFGNNLHYSIYFERPSSVGPENRQISLLPEGAVFVSCCGVTDLQPGQAAIIFNSGRLAIGKKWALV